MEYVRLGRTGLKVSRLCLGMMTYGTKQWRPWVMEEEESLPLIRKAWEMGINFFDTADMYSLGVSEEILGRAIRKLGIRRDQVVIATKVYNAMGEGPNDRGLGRKHLRHAVEGS
jgi:aryl-alcohol dehydrogenase-like predicted oxidoreductase